MQTANDFLSDSDPKKTLSQLEEDLTFTFSKAVIISDEVVYPFSDFPIDPKTLNGNYLDYKYRTEKDDYTFLAFSHINWKEEFEGTSKTEFPFSVDGQAILVCTKTKEILHTKDFTLHLERKEGFDKKHGVKV